MTNIVKKRSKKQYDFGARLSGHQKIIDQSVIDNLSNYTKNITKDFGQYSDLAIQSFNSVAVRGGKRLRGSLVIESYFLHGGKDEQLALQLATAIEIVHAYLLVIDDFCDKSETRRGELTANKEIELYHKKIISEETLNILATA